MAERRPRLLIVGGEIAPGSVLRESLSKAFELVGEGESPDLVIAPAITPVVGGSDAMATVLNSTGEGVSLSDASGASLWANDLFKGLDAKTRERLAASAAEAATVMGTARRLVRVGDEVPLEAGVWRGEVTSTDQARYFDVMVSPVDARPLGPVPAGEPAWPRAVAVVVRDVTQAKRLRQRMDAVDRAGGELVQIESDAVRNKNMIERLQLLEKRIVEYAHTLLHFDHFAIRLLDEKTGKLELVIKRNLPAEYDAFEIYPKTEGNGISGWVAATGKSYVCRDVQADELFLPGLHGARSSLTIPLKLHDKVVGIMNVESQAAAAFDEDDRRLGEIFARYIAMAVHTLDLLVVERTTTNRAIAGRFAEELSEPLQDICNEVDVLRGVAAGNLELVRHIDKIRADVEAIRQRMDDVAHGPTTLLGVERAMEERVVDPALVGRRVLIADDQSRIRRIIGDVLRNRGCVVTLCEHGGQAIEFVGSVSRGEIQPFGLIVSDIMMPQANGYEVFSAARKIMPTVPVILMTGFGYDPNHSIVRASQEGLQSVLFKPFQVEQLVDLVKKALEVKA